VAGTANPLKGLDPSAPVSVRDVSGGWMRVEYAAMTGGATWIQLDNVVAYRLGR
jgi:hypothetical protein